MAGNQSDIDIKATITTEADLKGVQAADKAVDNLGKTTGKSTADQVEGVEALDKAITGVGESADKAAVKTVEGTEEVVKTIADQQAALDALLKTIEETEAAGKKALEQQAQKIEELRTKEQALITKIGERSASNSTAAKAAVRDNQTVLESIKWLQSEWAKYAQVVSGVFSAVGLVKMAVGTLKEAWDNFNFETIRRDKAHQEQLVQMANKVKELSAAYDQARQAQADLVAAQLRQMDEDKTASRYAREAADIEAAGDALIRFHQLQASLNNNQQERTRIELDRQLYKGQISQADYDKFQVDRAADEKQDQRNSEHAAALADYNNKLTAASQATSKLTDATQDYERIVRNPKYMTPEAFAKSQQDKAIAERELRGTPGDEEKRIPGIKGLLSRWSELQNRLIASEEMVKRSSGNGTLGGAMAQAAARGEAEKIKNEMEPILNSIQKNKEIIAMQDAKRKDFEELTYENTYTKDPTDLWKMTDGLGEKMKGLEQTVEDLGKAMEAALADLNNIEKVQAGQQGNDNLERKYKMEQIAEEEKKKKEEETAAAIKKTNEEIDALKSRIKELGNSASGADEAMRESLENQLQDKIFDRNRQLYRQRGENITARAGGETNSVLDVLRSAESRGTPYAGSDMVQDQLKALLDMARDQKIDQKESRQIDGYIRELQGLIKSDGGNEMTQEMMRILAVLKSAYVDNKTAIKRGVAELAQVRADLENLRSQSANQNS